MKGWRLLELDGNEEFHQSLSALPANKRFKLAGHFIFIRGGDRASAGPSGANATLMGPPPGRGNTGPSGKGKGFGKGKSNQKRSEGGLGLSLIHI